MIVEFLKAFEDGTWETEDINVPGLDEQNAEKAIAWAAANLGGLPNYTNVVCFAVYSFPADEDEGQEVLTGDQVISEVAAVLSEADGYFLESIANRVLSRKVKHVPDSRNGEGVGDDLFTRKPEKE